jgi:hypothetical protein
MEKLILSSLKTVNSSDLLGKAPSFSQKKLTALKFPDGQGYCIVKQSAFISPKIYFFKYILLPPVFFKLFLLLGAGFLATAWHRGHHLDGKC